MKIVHFIGVCGFTSNVEVEETNFGKGLWDNELVVSSSDVVEEENIQIPLPAPIDEMGKGIIGKVPRFPNEGINEIEGWIICESVEEGKAVLEQFSQKFGEVHNKPKEIDPFLQFLMGMRDMLSGLREELEKDKENPENVDKPEEMTQDHESEG